jgi:hypothetical protein
MNVFITGDRSLSPLYTPLVAIEMLRAMNAGKHVVTTDSNGVAHIVRDLAQRSGVEITVLPAPISGDWEEYHENVVRVYQPEEIVAVHVDPLASSVLKSLLNRDELRVVTHAELMD